MLKRNENIVIYIILLLLVPLFITLLFLLPPEMKDVFLLYQNNPTIISVFFSNYLHITFNHFAANIIFYFILTTLILKIDEQIRIKKALIPLFIFVPFVVSMGTIWLYPKTNDPFLGFSGIVAAFAGYFLTSVWIFLKRLKQETDEKVLFLFIIFNLTLTTYVNHVTIFSIDLWPYLFVISVGIIAFMGNYIFSLLSLLQNHLKSKRIHEAFVISLLIFFAILSLFSLAPLVAVSQIDSGTNLIGHYVGYICGLTIGLLIAKSQE